MKYNGLYFYPPRTESCIPFGGDLYKVWCGYNSIGQYKLNGTRNIIRVSPNGDVDFWNRHNERQNYKIPSDYKQYLSYICPKGYWTVLDSELLHFKTVGIKNLIYIFDCLVWKSEYLYRVNYEKRYSYCSGLLNVLLSIQSGEKYFSLGNTKAGIYLARNYSNTEWDNMWEGCKGYDYCEGLVLKRNDIGLLHSTGVINNDSFMVKVRRGSKNKVF